MRIGWEWGSGDRMELGKILRFERFNQGWDGIGRRRGRGRINPAKAA